MDMNELSRKMYEGVPVGGTLFTVDKIGLQVETQYLNKANLEPWKNNNYITILTFGNTAHINIHAEFEPQEEHLGKRCLDALFVLMNGCVFTVDFTFMFCQMLFSIYPILLLDKSYSIIPISCFFKVVEWEWAMDFLDYPLFSSIDTNSEKKGSLKPFKNSTYSRDGKVTKRFRTRDGKLKYESKGKQQSLLCCYDRAARIGAERPIARIEVRQQGKYKNALSTDLLDGNKELAFEKVVPVIGKQIKKLVHKKALILSDYWNGNMPEEYKKVFDD